MHTKLLCYAKLLIRFLAELSVEMKRIDASLEKLSLFLTRSLSLTFCHFLALVKTLVKRWKKEEEEEKTKAG